MKRDVLIMGGDLMGKKIKGESKSNNSSHNERRSGSYQLHTHSFKSFINKNQLLFSDTINITFTNSLTKMSVMAC